MKTESEGLTIFESLIVLFLIVFLSSTLINFFPDLFNNFFFYPIITIFLYGGIIYFTLKFKGFSIHSFFYRKKLKSNFFGFVFLTCGFFLLWRIILDLEDFLILGKEKFLIEKKDFIYYLTQRQGKHFLTIIFVTPILEELLFRGLLLNSFLIRFSKLFSIIVISILFSLFHFQTSSIALIGMYFFSSSFYSWALLYTKNIKIPIMCHISWNFFNYLLPFIFAFLNLKVISPGQITYIYIIMFLISVVFIYIGFKTTGFNLLTRAD